MNKGKDWNFEKLLENGNFKILIWKLESLKKYFENGISKN